MNLKNFADFKVENKAIGLIDFDGKNVNLALMKISTFFKNLGFKVYLNNFSASQVDKVFCSVLFTWNMVKAEKLKYVYPNIEFGGTGYSLEKKLPEEVEKLSPDYNLYRFKDIYPRMKGIMKKETKIAKSETIVNAGIGRTSTGCIRACAFCIINKKEGCFKQADEIKDIVRPNSNILTLLDNNITADPYCVDKLNEIKERNLIVDITQGIDIRLMTSEKARALSDVKHLRSIHYAWDLMEYENQVLKGIDLFSEFVKPYRHMCFVLVGFNTTFCEDMYRVRKLIDRKVDPYVMIYNKKKDNKELCHFARWINSRIYKKCSFNEYEPYKKWLWNEHQKRKKSYSVQLSLDLDILNSVQSISA